MTYEYLSEIDAYAAGELKGREEVAFEEKLKTDPILREQYEGYLSLLKELEYEDVDTDTYHEMALFSQTIEEVLPMVKQGVEQGNSMEKEPIKRIFSLKPILSIAASIVLVLGLAWWLIPLSETEIEGSRGFVTMIDHMIEQRQEQAMGGQEIDSIYLSIFDKIKKVEYESAISEIDDYLTVYSDEDKLALAIKAFLLIKKENTSLSELKDAERTLIRMYESGRPVGSIDLSEVHYSLSIGYIRQGENAKAHDIVIAYLEDNKDCTTDKCKLYNTEFKKLLDKINSYEN